MKHLPVLFLLCLLHVSEAQAQPGLAQMIHTLKASIRQKEVEQFYRLTQEQAVWLHRPAAQERLIELLGNADDYGLNPKDYQLAYLQQQGRKPLLDRADSLEAEVRLTDAALHFFTELKAGNHKPSLSYEGIRRRPDVSAIPNLLKTFLEQDMLDQLAGHVQPSSPEFLSMTQKLRAFNRAVRDKNFTEVKITSSKTTAANKPLLLKLQQLGVLDSVSAQFTDREVALKLKEAQKLFDVLGDGRLRSTTLAALNVPLKRRIAELKLAMNWLRWLDGMRHESIAILNIPAAQLYVYAQDKQVLQSRVVVGKASTPTPTLSSTISEVILYPYWHVPNKIATRELLPRIKRDIGYLSANQFQVLNTQGRVINPYSINWHALSASYFPYKIRQSTGCDNSLGIVKFNFYNPFSVYLHDTPNKSLFSYNKRYYSHGCMRLEMFEDMAHLLLGRNRVAIDTLISQGCLESEAPTTLEAENPVPIFVIYSTLWYTPEGSLKFYDDVYDRLPALLKW